MLVFTFLGTVMTPNYIDSSSLSVAPWCDCSNSGNDMEECSKFLNFFKDNTCLSELKKKKKGSKHTNTLSSVFKLYLRVSCACLFSLSLSCFFLLADGESSGSWPYYAMQQSGWVLPSLWIQRPKRARDSNNGGYIMSDRTLLPTDQILMLATSTKSVPKVLKTRAQYAMWEAQTN